MQPNIQTVLSYFVVQKTHQSSSSFDYPTSYIYKYITTINLQYYYVYDLNIYNYHTHINNK